MARSRVSNVRLPNLLEFCSIVRHPRIDDNGGRKSDWTAFAKIVSEEYDKFPGDIEGAMKRAESKI